MAAPMDTDPPTLPPLKVWVMSMNRHVTTDEIVRGLNKIEDEDVRKTCLNKPTRDECIRSMISKLYPIIVMQHKLSRYRFKRAKSSTGKEYFQSQDPNYVLGYSVADTGSLVGMAWATGSPSQVVNIGLDVMKFSIPRNTTVTDFFESQKHKLTEREQRDVLSGNSDETLLRRILIILTIKTAYIKAIQQPPGFDYRRMECSLPTQQFRVDNHELLGWEIRMFKANLGIQRKEALVEEVYQCCAMIHRGGRVNRVYWNDKEGEATEMLNFLKVDQIVRAYDGLGVRNGQASSSAGGRTRTHAQQQQQQQAAQAQAQATVTHSQHLQAAPQQQQIHQLHHHQQTVPVHVGPQVGMPMRRIVQADAPRRSSEDARMQAGVMH